jgi:hypothetical protein
MVQPEGERGSRSENFAGCSAEFSAELWSGFWVGVVTGIFTTSEAEQE